MNLGHLDLNHYFKLMQANKSDLKYQKKKKRSAKGTRGVAQVIRAPLKSLV
jgi:hypothetical protein